MRRSIALVTAAGLLPIIALSGAFGVATLLAERAAVRNGADAAASFVATIAAVRLGDGMREVDMIAQSPAFDGPIDVERFRTLALRLRNTSNNWRYLSIADADGQRLVDVPAPMGGKLGPVIDMASLKQAVATRRPVVGNVLVGPSRRYAFAVRAPVVRTGTVRYVVSAVIPAEAAGALLQSRPLPPGWRAAVVDGAGNVVATSAPSATSVGERVSAAGFRARQSGKPGFYLMTRRDGTEGLATWRPIAGTNWSAHVSAPVASYAVANKNAWILLAAVVIIALVLLALIVRLLAHEMRLFRAREEAAVQRQRLEAIGRLTGGIAHDFNNLLQPVMGGLDLLSRRLKDDEKAQRHIALAMAGAERARALVARLLAFSRQQSLASAPVDIARMLGGLEDLLDRSITPAVRLEIALPDSLPLVEADVTQLELAVLNLAINARDAMAEGGTIRITAEPLEVAQADDLEPGHYVAISVSDTGVGMDEVTMRKAIDPFFTTKSADKGTGLGLSMVHGFALQSGGALRLQSRPGTGTTATLVMPVAADQSREQKPVADRPSHSKAAILLVDDDQHVRRSIADLLREAGHAVSEAGSVDQALALFDTGLAVDLVITDFLMPDRNGAELCRELELRDPGLPILLITGNEAMAEEAGLHGPRLVKPFRADELLSQVAALLAGPTPAVPA